MFVETVVPLVNGVWRDDRWHGNAAVRPLTGADQAILLDARNLTLPAERITILLAAATRAIGEIKPVSPDIIRCLTIGDRERLVLALHAVTFGPQVEVVARCTDSSCGELFELPLKLDEMLRTPEQTPARPEHALMVATEEGSFHVRFRLPNGADQELVARIGITDLSSATDRLLTRCIISVIDGTGRSTPPEGMLDILRSPLEDAIRTIDRGADTSATVPCPTCGHNVPVFLDPFALLTTELARSDAVFLEVDRLARAYHWSEADILALPVTRRRRYLALLDRAGSSA
jgi:hypothetical protein